MTEKVYSDYFLWLCDLIAPYESYMKLLYILYTTPFDWLIDADEDRNKDGLRLREIYVDSYPMASDIPTGDSSDLEVLISIAIMIEDQYMHDPKLGDRTGKWFWMMIDNLGISQYSDSHDDWDEYYNEVIIWQKIVDWGLRRYDSNGVGGIFPLKKSVTDQKKVSLLYQMHAYLQENFGLGKL